MGRPLGPSGGRDPGGGGTGLPEGLAVAGRHAGVGAASGGACAAARRRARGRGAWPAPAAAGAGPRAGRGLGPGRAGGAPGAGRRAGAAGGGVGRLLLIRRDERGGRSGGGGGARGCGSGGRAERPRPAPTPGGGAFLTGPLLGAELLDTEVSGRRPAPRRAAASAPGGSGWGLRGLRRLLGRSGLLGLDGAPQTLGVGLAAVAVGRRVLDRGRVALDPDAQGKGKLGPFLVGEA